jgi:HTH-type transcriptional regulator, bacterioopsin transcriptional activator and related proteins
LVREDNLRDECASLRMLQETPAGLWLVDAAGSTAWVNPAASELVGIRAEELLGARAPEFLIGGDAGPFGDLQSERESDRKLTRPDGSTVWMVTTAKPLIDDGGRRTGTLFTLIEVNERKEREIELRMRLEATEALVELAELSFDAPSPRVILARAVGLVAEQLDAALASISTVDLEQDQIHVLAASDREEGGWAKELEDGGPIRITGQSLARAAVANAEPVVVDDFDHDPSLEPSPQLTAHGIRSAAFVPLDDGESVLAALGDEPNAVGRSSLPFIESVATMIARYRIQEREMRRARCTDPGLRGSWFAAAPGCGAASPRPYGRGRRPGSV